MKIRHVAEGFLAAAFLLMSPGVLSTPPATVPTARVLDRQDRSTGFAPQGLQDLVDTLRTAGRFSTFSSLVAAADLDGTLRGRGPYTVFAPTDEAMGRLPREQSERLLRESGRLKAFVEGHVVRGDWTARKLREVASATTLAGSPLRFSKDSEGLAVNGVTLERTRIQASNGEIFPLDSVLIFEP